MDKWLTIGEVSKELQIAETTARRYAELFSTFIPNRKIGRFNKYSPDTLHTFRQIGSLYQIGYDTKAITDTLKQTKAQTYDISETINTNSLVGSQEALQAIVNQLEHVIRVSVEESVRTHIESLQEQIRHRDEQITKLLEHHEQQTRSRSAKSFWNIFRK